MAMGAESICTLSVYHTGIVIEEYVSRWVSICHRRSNVDASHSRCRSLFAALDVLRAATIDAICKLFEAWTSTVVCRIWNTTWETFGKRSYRALNRTDEVFLVIFGCDHFHAIHVVNQEQDKSAI
jgi:hypothetical protein